MKKTITLILAVVLCISVVLTVSACGSSAAVASTAAASASTDTAAAVSGTPATAKQLADLKTKYDALVAAYANMKAAASADPSYSKDAAWNSTFDKLGATITQIGDQVKNAKTTEEITLLATAMDTMTAQLGGN
ncbi:MAG: hypothetical protein WCP73_08545 [Eubacteriales bacterium]